MGAGRWRYLGYFRVRSFSRWKTRGQRTALGTGVRSCQSLEEGRACGQVETDMSLGTSYF